MYARYHRRELYSDLILVGIGIALLIGDAYSLGKLASVTKDDPSRSKVDTDEASTPEPDEESGE